MDLCLVSMGAADGYYELSPHCWDFASGLSIVSDAGGVVIPAGGEFEVMARRVQAAATPDVGCQIDMGDIQIYHSRDDEMAAQKLGC